MPPDLVARPPSQHLESLAPPGSLPGSLPGPVGAAVVAVIPAWNEEGSVAGVVRGLRDRGIETVIVADNGSTDRTAEFARLAGAAVVPVARRGYGSACLGGLAAVPAGARAVVFCDADGADDLDSLGDLCTPVLSGELDLMVGSRALGRAERGALTLPQRFGNRLSTFLIRALLRTRVTDLGPFRCVSSHGLERLRMQDQGFGWTVEMQVKAIRLGLRYGEIAVDAKRRKAGHSKISGNLRAASRAGRVILSTIWRYRRFDGAEACA